MQLIRNRIVRSSRRAAGLLALVGTGVVCIPLLSAQSDPQGPARMGVLMWGDNAHGQCDIPILQADVKNVQLACGTAHTLALQSNGQLVAWGLNDHGQLNVPVPPAGLTYTRVAASDHNLALRSDGSILAFGRNDFGQCDVPSLPEGITWAAISAGAQHSAALSSDGAIYCWGDDSFAQCEVPKPPLGMSYSAVSAGARHTVALRSDGHVVCWGDNSMNQARIPDLYLDVQFIAISAGGAHTLALTASGRIAAWGSNESRQCAVPNMRIGARAIDIAAGGRHSLALLDDGTILCWGANDLGQCNPPKKVVNFEVLRISAGAQHSALQFHAYPPEIQPICTGDGSYAPCPCRNEVPLGKIAGCRNSSKQGGSLFGSGHARVLEDDLSLFVTGLPDTIAVVLQGGPNASSHPGSQGQAPLGDGIYCLRGRVSRLGVIRSGPGSFVFPDVGTPPLSVLGRISSAREVTYQVWFRDPQPVCKGDGGNTTNALRVVWTL